MTQERLKSIVEEIAEVQSLDELKALHCFGQEEGNEYGDAECVPYFRTAVARLRNGKEERIEQTGQVVNEVEEKIKELEARIEALRSGAAAVPVSPVQPATRGSKKYRLLKTEVAWSTKPQVHALVAILAAHAKVGDVLDEDDIVRMCVANEGVLKTRQGGKRIWDYYGKGGMDGLVTHGNLQKV